MTKVNQYSPASQRVPVASKDYAIADNSTFTAAGVKFPLSIGSLACIKTMPSSTEFITFVLYKQLPLQ